MVPQRPLHLACLALSLAAACGRVPLPQLDPAAPPRLELPRDVRPLRYDLHLTLRPDRERFEGEVVIEVELRRPVAGVWLHARELLVSEASVEIAGAWRPGALAQATADGVVRFEADRVLPAGRATLRFAFSAPWSERPAGLFRERVEGVLYAYTQAQPVDARRIFPCFDDPAFRAPFRVELTVPAGDVAVSNAPAVAEEPAGPGLKRVRFADTEPLPTSLVFAAAGPFEVIAPPPLPPRGVRTWPLPLRVLAPRAHAEVAGGLLAAARGAVHVLEDWTARPFPYPKLDAVISAAFEGGMENPGAMLFGAAALAQAPGDDGTDAAELVAHEVAHQWFGDLAGMAAWRDAPLDEALATLLSWKVLAALDPAAPIAQRAAAQVDEAMDADALPHAQAFRRDPTRTDGAGELFDPVSYAKGAGVLAGYERFLGEARFREAVRAYLAARPRASTSFDALAGALSAAAGRDVARALQSVLDRPGVPLVLARVSCTPGGARVELALSRERPQHARAGEAEGQGPFAAVPPPELPVCVRYEAAGVLGEACALVEGGQGSVRVPACPRWVLPAAGGAGYHRWAMAPGETGHLRDAGFVHLAAVERLAWAQALRASALAGRTPLAEALAALAPLARDGDPDVAAAPLQLLELAVEELVPRERRAAARARAAELYRARARELGLDPRPAEPPAAARLRRRVLEFMAFVARDPETARGLAARGRAWFAARAAPEAARAGQASGLEDLALRAAVAEGDEAFARDVEARLHATPSPELRGVLVAGLSGAIEPTVVARALALVGDERLSPGERARVVEALAGVPETRDAAWRALQKRWDEVAPALFAAGASALPRLAEGLCDRGRAVGVRKFLEKRAEDLPVLTPRIPEAVDRLERCAGLREALGASAAAWFTAGR